MTLQLYISKKYVLTKNIYYIYKNIPIKIYLAANDIKKT